MTFVTTAIGNFVEAAEATHPDKTLLARWSAEMETQIMVSPSGGEPVDGKPSTFSDGVRSWHHIRIPKKADSEPEFNDYEISWPISVHAEALGSTGWNWVAKCSKWVAFDFDDITSHAAGVGITPEKLEEVKQAAMAVPWVEVRKSTGGKGLHFYVTFETGIPTANHTEHAALARTVLGVLSTAANFDFAAQIDACGGIIWLWHKKMSAEAESFKLQKKAERAFTVADLPTNWKDNVEVVTRKRRRVKVVDVDENEFETLATARKFVPLEDSHKKVIQALADNNQQAVWVPDFHLLQTHTSGFEKLCNDPEIRTELGIVGFFSTASSGSTVSNCFAFPLPGGVWKVVRHGRGVREAETWQQDGANWTWCYFNKAPDLKAACVALGGDEKTDDKGFEFETASAAIRAAGALGQEITLPDEFMSRKALLRRNKDGRLVMEVVKYKDDAKPDRGWVEKGRNWVRVFTVLTEVNEPETDFDSVLRVLVTPKGETAGTFVASESGAWDTHNQGLVRMYLQGLSYTKAEAEEMIGNAVRRRWEKVSLPFQSEYPGSRRWNLNAAQLKIVPADNRDVLSHPHWDQIFEHCGQSLTPYLEKLSWAQDCGMRTGADYLKAWFAVVLREPFSRLPYLFLYGPEKSGKSTLWMAFNECLVTRGVVRADRALTSEFNGELEGAVLCVIEEKNVAKDPNSFNRMKDYVTASDIAIRRMRSDVYHVRNSTHWLQTSNDWNAGPIAEGDTRITALSVPAFLGRQISWSDLRSKLDEEAPALLRTLLDLKLPPQIDRLRVPVVETDHKRQLAASHRNELEQFLAEQCHIVPGAKLKFADFHQTFQDWLPEGDRAAWTKIRTKRSLPLNIVRGHATDNVITMGNISFSPEPVEDSRPWIQAGEKIVRQE